VVNFHRPGFDGVVSISGGRSEATEVGSELLKVQTSKREATRWR
uniref:Uncharacterized protein n=1 Tax=Anopheles dirus TaxID=7168 RepID=A0A182NXR1_9DIPT